MKIRIYPKRILKIFVFSILFFALLKPDSLDHIGLKWLDISLVIIDGMLMFIMFFFAVIRKIKVSGTTFIIILIYFFIGLSTLFGTKDLFSLLKVSGTAIGAGLFTDYCMQKDPEIYFKAGIFTLIILFSINCITILKYYPVGMYRLDYVVGDLYFMGHDNAMIYNLVPLCSLSFIFSYIKKKKILNKVSLYAVILTFFSEFYVKSATGIIEVLLLLLLFTLINNKKFDKLLNPKLLFFTYILLNLLVVIFRIQNNFSWFFVDILGKDLTFTGRTYLWDYAINMINYHSFLGYGMGVEIIGNGHIYPNAHCLILDFLFKGGFFSLMSFLLLMINFNINYRKSENKVIAKMILIPIIVLLTGEITAAIPYKPLFWSLFVLINYSDSIENLYEKKRGLNE